VLVFALPCYLIFTLCTPLSLLGLWLLATMLLDSIVHPKTIDDLRGFAPLAIASATAGLGVPALWMFAKLLVRIFRNTIRVCSEKGHQIVEDLVPKPRFPERSFMPEMNPVCQKPPIWILATSGVFSEVNGLQAFAFS
jgi:hypothetical protein